MSVCHVCAAHVNESIMYSDRPFVSAFEAPIGDSCRGAEQSFNVLMGRTLGSLAVRSPH